MPRLCSIAGHTVIGTGQSTSVLATTHGELASSSCSTEELSQLRARGFAFRKQNTRRIKLDGLPEFYQTSFHSKRYVMEHWSKILEVVSYVPGGIQNHQDMVVLRREQVLE